YDRPQTPLDRLLASGNSDPAAVTALQHLRQRLDPFALAEAIEQKLARIYRLADRRQSPRPIPRGERTPLREVERPLGIPLRIGGAPTGLKRHYHSVTSSMAR
ncbi:MAG: hypothetical protein QME77_04495, partial [bacterium]|nr:hypothetical protein [bacterium]